MPETAQLHNWIVHHAAIGDTAPEPLYGIFPSYAWTGALAAIDLMAAEVRTLRLEMASLDDATATMRNQADALRKECADEKSRRHRF